MSLIIIVVICAVTAFLAYRKGYHPAIWFFAGGIIGLIVLAFLPFCNKPEEEPELNAKRKKTGNITGAVIAGVSILLSVLLFLLR